MLSRMESDHSQSQITLLTLECLLQLGCSSPGLSATCKYYLGPQTWIKCVLEQGPQMRPKTQGNPYLHSSQDRKAMSDASPACPGV